MYNKGKNDVPKGGQRQTVEVKNETGRDRRPLKKLLIATVIVLTALAAIGIVLYFTGYFSPPDTVDGSVKVHIIDVGQADSILIETEDGCMLIDTGTPESEEELRDYLWSRGITTIEYLVLTHGHMDHYGGAEMVLKTFRVKNIIYDNYNNSYSARTISKINAEEGATVIDPWQKQKFKLGDAIFTVLYATDDNEDLGDNRNDYSTVLRMDFGGSSFVFTGDATKTVEYDILGTFSKEWLDCDFLKSGHHGSYTSSGKGFISTLTPEFVAVSCGRDNEYGHPHKEVLQTYSNAGCEVYRTDISGTLVFVSDGTTITYVED